MIAVMRDERTRKKVTMVIYPDVQVLDVTGPVEVFNVASRLLEADGRSGGYSTELLAPVAGVVATSGGIRLVADRAMSSQRGPIDTLMVAGGIGSRTVCKDAALVGWVARASRRSRRVASICSGAAILAAAGLLDGRRATTHWAYADELARSHREIEVDPDPVYVRDGSIYTSAGVTSGMDLALAMVEEDFGRELALSVARWLVMFLKRPGGQSQFSAQLAAQEAEREPLREVQAWVLDNLSSRIAVEDMASRAGMSARNFARAFVREVGVTPARFVERARVEQARRRLEESRAGVEEIADDCGFGSAETMRRAFLRNVRVAPADYRSRFQMRH